MDTVAQMADLLECFNRTGQLGLGLYLQAVGAQGYRCDPQRCVLATYLAERTAAQRVRVYTRTTVVDGTVIPNPQRVRDFIAMFDRHWFPEITVQPPVRQEELKKTAQLVAKLTPAQRRCLSMADLRQGIVPDHVPGNVTADAPSVLATSCM